MQANETAANANVVKSKYYKYLESLCVANGINIGTIKKDAAIAADLEMYFGGLPVLVGLKYFTNLRCLRIFGQDIKSVKPLSEVAGTLDELWLCEGKLKDLSGIELCVSLRRLYLYENEIVDGKPLSKLVNLDILWLMENQLADISFLSGMIYLTNLKLADNRLTDKGFRPVGVSGCFRIRTTLLKFGFSFQIVTPDAGVLSALMTVKRWPDKLEIIDLSGNDITNFQSLYPLSKCTVLRSICFRHTAYKPCPITSNDRYGWWMIYHFPNLESLDDDMVIDATRTALTKEAQTELIDCDNSVMKLRNDCFGNLKSLHPNTDSVIKKVLSLTNQLQVAVESAPKKDGIKETVQSILVQARANLDVVRLVEKEAARLAIERSILMKYFAAIALESCKTTEMRDIEATERSIIAKFLSMYSSVRLDVEAKLHGGKLLTTKLDMHTFENLFLVECDEIEKLWDVDSVIHLLDHYKSDRYLSRPAKLFKDIGYLQNEYGATRRVFHLPVVFFDPFAFGNTLKYSDSVGARSKSGSKGSALSVRERSRAGSRAHIEDYDTVWEKLTLIAVITVEMVSLGHIEIFDLFHPKELDHKMSEQVQKLKESGINVVIDTTNVENIVHKRRKSFEAGSKRTLFSFFSEDLLLKRATTEDACGKVLSVRTPLELTLAYSRQSVFDTMQNWQVTVTGLNLMGLQLTSITGLEQFLNLKYLSLSHNKLTSLNPLANLKNLHFLDASYNLLSKCTTMPASLQIITLCNNSLPDLKFCSHCQLLSELNCSMNSITALDGIFNKTFIDTLRLSYNSIADINQLEKLQNVSNLKVLDLSENPVVKMEGYRKRILYTFQRLETLDTSSVAKHEQDEAMKTMGATLTTEFLTKRFQHLNRMASLALPDMNFQFVSFGSKATIIEHIVELDLSGNRLKNFYDLKNLNNLTYLDLSGNNISSVFGEKSDERQPVMSKLKRLKLNSNGIISMASFGLNYLPTLNELHLTDNSLMKLESPVFDLPHLEVLNLSSNQIKSIDRRPMNALKVLCLESNRLKEFGHLRAPLLEDLNISQNRIPSCTGLKGIANLTNLRILNCSGNPVTQRNVYKDFVVSHASKLDTLDGERVGLLEKALGQLSTPGTGAFNDEEQPEPSNKSPTLNIFHKPTVQHQSREQNLRRMARMSIGSLLVPLESGQDQRRLKALQKNAHRSLERTKGVTPMAVSATVEAGLTGRTKSDSSKTKPVFIPRKPPAMHKHALPALLVTGQRKEAHVKH